MIMLFLTIVKIGYTNILFNEPTHNIIQNQRS